MPKVSFTQAKGIMSNLTIEFDKDDTQAEANLMAGGSNRDKSFFTLSAEEHSEVLEQLHYAFSQTGISQKGINKNSLRNAIRRVILSRGG